MSQIRFPSPFVRTVPFPAFVGTVPFPAFAGMASRTKRIVPLRSLEMSTPSPWQEEKEYLGAPGLQSPGRTVVRHNLLSARGSVGKAILRDEPTPA